MTSGSISLDLEHHAILTNTLFKVKSVPLLYMPVFYYPVNKEDRATGFLIPLYGTSTIKGQTISNAFFWAINRSQDATFLHDWFSKTGQGTGGDYRYRSGRVSFGNLRGYTLREHETTYTDDDGKLVTTPERRSYEVRGEATQSLGAGLQARGRADYFSDITVQQTYHTNIYEASRRERVYSGAVTGSWNAYSLSGTYRSQRDVFRDDQFHVERRRRRGWPSAAANVRCSAHRSTSVSAASTRGSSARASRPPGSPIRDSTASTSPRSFASRSRRCSFSPSTRR